MATTPLTGEAYLESLRDGREVFIYGEKVPDVTAHPAFRNAARMLARLYDALHDPEKKAVLCTETDTGSGGYTHWFFKAPRTADDLVHARDAIAEWQRIVYGWMGRTPDYKASFIGAMGANTAFFAPFEENARRWYRESQEKVLYWNHAIVNPPIDRHRPPEEVMDVYLHVEEETDAGLIVSGAKVVATGSALTHVNFIAHYGPLPVRDKRMAIIFAVPMNAPGLKLICRPSYEFMAEVVGSPFDYPLSSRFDENDAIIVFDRVLIPWENVFLYGDVERVNLFLPASGFMFRALFHGCTRLAVKLDFIAGLLLKASEVIGTQAYRGVQVRLGEVLAWRNLFWGLTDAMARTPVPWGDGYVSVNPDYAAAYRVLATVGYPRVKEIVMQDVASALVYLPSHARDFLNPEERKYLEKYVRGSNGYPAKERAKLLKLLWDAIGTEFGGRHELYERNYAGNHENIRLEALLGAMASGETEALKQFAEKCLAEYDLEGWKVPDLINPDDVNIFTKKPAEESS